MGWNSGCSFYNLSSDYESLSDKTSVQICADDLDTNFDSGLDDVLSDNDDVKVAATALDILTATMTEDDENLDYEILGNLSSWLFYNGSFLDCDPSCNYTQTSNQFALSWWQQLVWTLVFAGMVIVATGGNLIVIWIVVTHKRMRSITNYFLVNLSVADTMVSTLNVIFNFVYMLSRDWMFGEVYCKVSNFVAVVSVAASVFTMMAISVDRYIAIMSPLRPRMSKMTTLIIMCLIWMCSSVLSLPNLMYSMVLISHDENDSYRTICYMVWPDGETASSYQEYVYNVTILVLTYVLPISAMVFTYTRIGQELWGSQSIGECTAKQLESVKSKRRVVKMMIVVVIIFAICWLPYHVYFILVYYYQELIHQPYIQHIYLAIYWLAMSNSMYNPIIYCWMNSRFRHGFKRVFNCCPFVNINDVKSGDMGANNHTNVRYSCSHSPEMASRVERDMLVHISLHTLTDVVCDGGQSNGSRHSVGPMNLFRKLRERKPIAV